MIGTYLKPPLNNQLSVSKPIQAIEKRFLNQQGEYRWVLQHLRAIWSPSDGQATKLQCLVADLQDIHSQKLYETARLAERERLLMVEAMAHLGSWQMIFSTGQYWLSQECSRILGLNPNRIDPGPLMSLNFVHPQDREAIIHQVISLKQPATELTAALQLSPFEDLEADFRIIRPNREIRYITAKAGTRYAQDGRIQGLSGFILDITSFRLQEQFLIEANRLLSLQNQQMLELSLHLKSSLQETLIQSQHLLNQPNQPAPV